MTESSQDGARINALSSWQNLALRKEPQRLLNLSRSCVAKTFALSAVNNFQQRKNDLRKVCHLLNTSLPLDLRTSLVYEIMSNQEIEEPHQVTSLVLLHLLTDVRHFSLTAGVKSGSFVHLNPDDCHLLLQEIENISEFRLESFRLDGVIMEIGVLSQILRRSPRLVSVHVSGDPSSEVLTYLESHPSGLRSLQLDNCTVTDEEVVRSLLRTGHNFETLGQIICGGGDATEIERSAQHSLRNLSIQSPLLTGCGSIVLLHLLRGLRHIQYTSWNSSTFETLLFLQKVAPQTPSFSLTSMDLWRPTEDALVNLKAFCPKLNKMMIECYDPSLKSLDLLSTFPELTTLTLRLMSQELIESAVKAAGNNLRELEIEFETFTFHSVSLQTVRLIQEYCPNLQRLEMRHVCVEAKPGDQLPSLKSTMFPNLKHLTLSSAVIQPVILEKILIGNSSLENLVLDVNQDALTDTVLSELKKNNHLDHLTSIFLGAGSLSAKAIASLIALPALTKLSLDLKRFPFIPVSTFNSLEADLIKGNFLCVLENVLQEES